MNSKLYVITSKVQPLRFVIIILWITINALGFFYGLQFFDETTTKFGSTPGTDSYEASNAVNEYFPAQTGVHYGSIFIQSFGEDVFTGDLANTLSLFNKDLLNVTRKDSAFYSMTSYYIFETVDLPLYAVAYVSDITNTSTFITVAYDASDDKEGVDFATDLLDNVNDLVSFYDLDSQVTVKLTGEDYFEMDSLDGVKKDSAVMDEVVGPCAFLVLAVVIQNAPVMIIPMLTIVSSMMLQFLLMYLVAQAMDVIAFVPSLMISLTFATSIDYSLFMLARFCEEQRLGKSIHDSIILMLESAGMTILMSGATLMVCFLGLLFFSMDLMQSIGVGAACTMFSVLLSTLTLMPALLYTWGDYIMTVHSYVNMEKLPIFGHLSPDYIGQFTAWCKVVCYSCCGWNGRDEKHQKSGRHTSDNDSDHSGDLLGNDYIQDQDPRLSKDPNRESIGNTLQRAASAPKDRSEEDEEILLALGTSILSDLGDNTTSFEDHSRAHTSGEMLLHSQRGGKLRTCDEEEDFFDEDGESMNKVKRSLWYRVGAFLLIKWKGVLACVIATALMLPIDVFCLDIKYDIDFIYMVPSDSDSYTAFESMSADFGAGFTVPYRIVYESVNPEVDNLYSEQGFQRVRNATDYMVENLPFTTLKSFFGGYMLDGEYVTFEAMSNAVALNVTESDSTERAYKLMYEQFFSGINTDVHPVLYCFFYLDTNPYSVDGTDWLKQARNLAPYMKEHFRLNIMYADGAAAAYDSVEEVYSEFPAMIAVTLSIVFILMAIAFRSIAAPARLILTIVLTLAFCYGFCVLTYQQGVMSFLNADAFAKYGSINWLPPVMCFTIIVGLGLDYDVFLVSRILEYREKGYSSDGSILKGIYKTGYVITDAGVIMAIAFSGLFLSNAVVLNQVAFLLCVSVLLDTFVIRTVLVPILMGLAGSTAWWPRKFEPPLPGETDFDYGFQDTSTPKVLKRMRSWFQ